MKISFNDQEKHPALVHTDDGEAREVDLVSIDADGVVAHDADSGERVVIEPATITGIHIY